MSFAKEHMLDNTNNNFVAIFVLIVLAFVCGVFSSFSHALEVNEEVTEFRIEGQNLYFLEAKGRGFAEVMEDESLVWRNQSGNTLSLGIGLPAYWFRFELHNNSFKSIERLLEIAYPVLDRIDVYFAVQGEEVRYEQLGDLLPFSQRLYSHRNFVIPIRFQPDQHVTVFLRVETQGALQLPITLWHERQFLLEDQKKVLWQGLFYGALLIMILYNFFIFTSIRERSYFLYVVFVALSLVSQVVLFGDGYQYLWSDFPWWNNKMLPLLGLGMVVSGYAFVNEFLGLNSKAPKFFKVLNILMVGAFFVCVASFFVEANVIFRAVSVIVFPVIFMGVYVSTSLSLKGDRTAQYFTLAWMSFFIGVIVFVLNKLGIIPRTFFSERGIQIGIVLDVLFLSFALGDRINRAGKEKIDAQQSMILSEKKARDAQESVLKMQAEANEELEIRVQERTQDLEVAMEELELLNQKLQDLNTIDALTGVKNRGFFETKYEHEWKRASREQACLAVLMVDVDRFKQINDRYGHLAGDHCLKLVAENIQMSARRPVDNVARYGGEEFVVILPNTDIGGARFVAENIRREVERLCINFEGIDISMTVSIGVGVCVPEDGVNEKRLIAAADSALYRAKQGGRNKVLLGEIDDTK